MVQLRKAEEKFRVTWKHCSPSVILPEKATYLLWSLDCLCCCNRLSDKHIYTLEVRLPSSRSAESATQSENITYLIVCIIIFLSCRCSLSLLIFSLLISPLCSICMHYPLLLFISSISYFYFFLVHFFFVFVLFSFSLVCFYFVRQLFSCLHAIAICEWQYQSVGLPVLSSRLTNKRILKGYGI